MLREKEIFLIRLMKVSDALVITVAFVLAYFFTIGIKQTLNLRPVAFATTVSFSGVVFFLRNHIALVLVTIPTWISLMSMDGVYSNFRTKLFIEILWRVMRTGVASLFVLGSAVFIFQMQLTSRFYVAMFAALALVGLFIEKAIWRWILDYIFRQGYNLVNLLIVGTGRRAQEFIQIVHAHSNWGLHIVGLIDDDPKLLGKHILDYEVIGRIPDIPRILRSSVVDRVIFVVPRIWLNRIEEAIQHCEREGIATAVCVDLYRPKLARFYLSNFAGIPLLNYQTAVATEWQLFSKRVFDVAGSFVLLLLLLPLLLAIAVGIRVNSRGPVLFKQMRCGLNGRRFTLFKFRSMYVGSEMRKKELQRLNEMSGPVFKMHRDPRVTPFGRLLRKFSMDELPQFFNVLKGDMSLVGPRPPLPEEVDMYETWQRRRLSMKPGITCIWQVSGRNKVDFERWMEMDLQYIDEFSLWLDLKLVARTVFVVLSGYGAA